MYEACRIAIQKKSMPLTGMPSNNSIRAARQQSLVQRSAYPGFNASRFRFQIDLILYLN